MGRKYVYLGKRVLDRGKKGLDKISEVRGIRNAIISDYKRGRIPKRKAASRMNLLKLVVMRDSDFKGRKRQKAIAIVDKGIQKLKGGKRKKKATRKGKGRRRKR